MNVEKNKYIPKAKRVLHIQKKSFSKSRVCMKKRFFDILRVFYAQAFFKSSTPSWISSQERLLKPSLIIGLSELFLTK